jgi:hypothetical protein
MTKQNALGIATMCAAAACVVTVFAAKPYDAVVDLVYVAQYTDKYNHGAGAIKVYGTFTPAAVLSNGNECFHGCEMQNGSCIDLSAKSNAWDVVATGWGGTGDSDGNRTTTFEDNATVAVLLGSRRVRSLEKIIDWSSAVPANREGVDVLRRPQWCQNQDEGRGGRRLLPEDGDDASSPLSGSASAPAFDVDFRRADLV